MILMNTFSQWGNWFVFILSNFCNSQISEAPWSSAWYKQKQSTLSGGEKKKNPWKEFWFFTLVIEKPLEDLDLQKGICYYYGVKYLKSPFSPALLFPRSCLCIKYALISFFSLPLHSFYLQSSLSLNYKVVHSMSPTLPLLFTFLFSLCLSSSQT